MNIKNQIYVMRKRINDEDLLKIKKIIDDEVERRTLAENNNAKGLE